jgi:hypothetical protein
MFNHVSDVNIACCNVYTDDFIKRGCKCNCFNTWAWKWIITPRATAGGCHPADVSEPAASCMGWSWVSSVGWVSELPTHHSGEKWAMITRLAFACS